MPLRDTFSKLKTAIVSTTTSKIDSKLDKAVKSIATYKSQSGRNGYIELVRSLISKTGDVNIAAGSGGLFAQASTPASFGQGGRLSRYKIYEAIVSNINYCHRALSVLVDNILSPDDITKISLEIRPETFLEDKTETESKSKLIEEIVQQLKIEESLHLLVRNTLEFGDLFCEIADDKTALTSRSILSEADYRELISSDIESDKKEILTYKKDKETYQITMDYSSFTEAEKIETNKEDEAIKITDVKLIFHDPRFVVKLQSALFPMCFGYLVFPQVTIFPGALIQDEPINDICVSILKSLEKKIPQIKELRDSEDLKDIVKSMISKTDNNMAMNIRYVPPDKVVHFKVPSTKYYPYGESIFDSCQFNAKVLIALETALAIQRISRSTEKRKISIEIGLPRDARKAVEAMKEEFRKRKISLDSFGSVDTIPCLDLSTEIRLVKKEPMTLDNIIKGFNEGYSFKVYSYDCQSGEVYPDKVVRARITGKDVEGVKVTLDNNESEICTPDHLWMLRDGTYVQAKELKTGDSLMPLYTRSYSSIMVKSVEVFKERITVGDIETERFHNFGLQSGVFVHNSQISTFEDIYIPQKDGKPYIDIDTFTGGNVDIRSKVDELKFIRDSIIASLGVPPSFIGIEENLSNKAALGEESILFARTIISNQTFIGHQINELIQKVLDLTHPEEALTLLDNISIALPSPRSLQFEREARYMSELVNLVETLDRIGVPKEYSKKKYLAQIDWDEVQKYETGDKIDKSLDPSKKKEEEGMAGMGAMGPGF